ncbi:unnamed protein product [Closterium sp. NIES-64]|nr:unnamed protein product [Closterium sp. NIES-64]
MCAIFCSKSLDSKFLTPPSLVLLTLVVALNTLSTLSSASILDGGWRKQQGPSRNVWREEISTWRGDKLPGANQQRQEQEYIRLGSARLNVEGLNNGDLENSVYGELGAPVTPGAASLRRRSLQGEGGEENSFEFFPDDSWEIVDLPSSKPPQPPPEVPSADAPDPPPADSAEPPVGSPDDSFPFPPYPAPPPGDSGDSPSPAPASLPSPPAAPAPAVTGGVGEVASVWCPRLPRLPADFIENPLEEFKALDEGMAKLYARRPDGQSITIWVSGKDSPVTISSMPPTSELLGLETTMPQIEGVGEPSNPHLDPFFTSSLPPFPVVPLNSVPPVVAAPPPPPPHSFPPPPPPENFTPASEFPPPPPPPNVLLASPPPNPPPFPPQSPPPPDPPSPGGVNVSQPSGPGSSFPLCNPSPIRCVFRFEGYEDRVPTLDITSALAEEVISPALVVLRGNRTCRVVAANSGEGRSICVHVLDEVYHATRSQFYANAEVVRVRQFNPLSLKRAFSNSRQEPEEVDEMADAQGAFVTRAFEKLLRESTGRKFQKLHQALKAYLDRPKGEHLVLVTSASRVDPRYGLPQTDEPGAAETVPQPQQPAQLAGTIPLEPAGSGDGSGRAHPNTANAANVTAAAAMAEAGHSLEGVEAELILCPLRLAIESKQSRLMETALDCLHKLISYGHLEGDCGLEGGKNNKVHTEIFQLVCSCADNTALDSVVLQVIKVILTAIASSTFQVHGDCLILALRTCYNIVLTSKSQVNLSTARGTLTQMLNIVFKRMEASELASAPQRPHAYPTPTKPSGEGPSEDQPAAAVDAASGGDGGGASAAAAAAAVEGMEGKEGGGEGEEEGEVGMLLLLVVVVRVVKGREVLGQQRGVERRELGRLLLRQTEGGGGSAGEGGGEEGAGATPAAPKGIDLSLLALAQRDALLVFCTPHQSRVTNQLTNNHPPSHILPTTTRGIDLSLLALAQRDALLVFRTLCKMAMKDGTEDLVLRTKALSLQLLQVGGLPAARVGLAQMAMKDGTEDLVLRTKALSLQLLQGLLESVSREFTLNFAFLDSIKMYLCYALVRAAVSPSDRIHGLACSIFATLIQRFRESLKAEIGLFFPLVVLRSLDSPDISPTQRLGLLRVLERLTAEPQLLADVFVNYDCDLDASNLFERMVTSLERLAQMPVVGIAGGGAGAGGAGAGGEGGAALVAAVKLAALQCLVNVVHALDTWYGKDKPPVPVGVVGEEKEEEGDEWKADGLGAVEEEEEEDEDEEEREGRVAKWAAAESQADQFGRAKAQKAAFETAVEKFNMKPEKGLAFLRTRGLLAADAAATAEFLRSTPGLDKTAIGDYLGHHDDYHLAVMHAYVDGIPFHSTSFDHAIRLFLKGFRLPGEAQKIDRIMEKFAEKYCKDNPGVFKTADSAYVLAYAVIMLNTDAHNPVVTAKMTKADFVRINSSLEGEESAPKELLEAIYDSIVSEEIKLRDDGGPGGAGGGGAGGAGRKEKGQLVTVLNLASGHKRSTVDVRKESDDIIKRTQAIVRRGRVQRGVFHSAAHADLARPMLEAVGWPLVATFAVTMEEGPSGESAAAVAALAAGGAGGGGAKSLVVVCMDGLRCAIHLAFLLGMETLRYALLTSLVRFTFLHAPRELRVKNLEAIRTLLAIAEQEPEALQDTWNAVLECVSRLEHVATSPAMLAVLGAPPAPVAVREALLGGVEELAGKPLEQVRGAGLSIISSCLPSETLWCELSPPLRRRGGVLYRSLRCLHRGAPPVPAPHHSFTPSHPTPSHPSLTQVFVVSSRLPSDAVVEFFIALCGVSAEELRQSPPRVFSLQKIVEISYYNMTRIRMVRECGVGGSPHGTPPPRVFSLQKIVEISCYNMTRIRMVWARIWSVLAVHFITAGQNPDEHVAMYAVDSIRQLALKYLERAELARFTFQNDILKPFVVLMRTSRSEKTRELIVQCVVQMIKVKVGGIKSGWRSVFMVLTTAATDSHEPIVESAFETVEQVVLEHFEQVIGDCFMDCVNCLMAFANNVLVPRISLKAIALLRICEDRLAEGRVPGGALRPVNEGEKMSDNEVAEYYWFPMLAGLSELTSDPRPEVRSCGVEVLFDLLRERGHKFSTRFWESVFERVLFPIFDYVRHAGTDGERPPPTDLWLRDTSIHCLHLLCDLFCDFYQDVAFILPSLLGLLLDCATRPDQSLAAIAVGAQLRLIDRGAPLFSSRDWAVLLDSLRVATLTTRPTELLAITEASLAASAAAAANAAAAAGDTAAATAATAAATAELSLDNAVLESGAADLADHASGSAIRTKIPTGDVATSLMGPNLSERIVAAPGGVTVAEQVTEVDVTVTNGGAEGEEGYGVVDRSGADEEAAGVGEGKGEEDGKVEGSGEGLANGEGTAIKPSASGEGDNFGKRLMDTLLLRNLSMALGGAPTPAAGGSGSIWSRASNASDAALASAVESEEQGDGAKEEEEEEEEDEEASAFPVADPVRVKCYTQLLLLGALNQLQEKHWQRLRAAHRRQLLDCIATSIDFAARFNSDTHLRMRIQMLPPERPPPSLLRQEVTATQLYLIVLLRCLNDPAAALLPPALSSQMLLQSGAAHGDGAGEGEEHVHGKTTPEAAATEGGRAAAGAGVGANGGAAAKGVAAGGGGEGEGGEEEEEERRRLGEEAEEQLLRVCGRVLEMSSRLQPNTGQAVEAEVHRLLALRAPVVARVLSALSQMDVARFERFVPHLYPHCTRLICSDQVEVRKALGDLFKARLTPLIPGSDAPSPPMTASA